MRATAKANLGGVQAARPSPMDRWDQPGMGDAEFLPRCIAAGCSPTNKITSVLYATPVGANLFGSEVENTW